MCGLYRIQVLIVEQNLIDYEAFRVFPFNIFSLRRKLRLLALDIS